MKRIVLMATVVLALAVGAASRNLLPDSSLIAPRSDKQLSDNWVGNCGPGATCRVDTEVRHGQSNSMRIAADPGRERAWHMVHHVVPATLRGQTPYTISAWVKTESMEPGALAYISLNCFSGARRLAANDSPEKIGGNSDWRRLVFTLPALPKGTQEARLVFCLCGGGTAWFTEPQVEEGTQATDYAPSAEDLAKAEQRARQVREAEVWLKSRGLDGAGLPRAAVLDLGYPAGRGEFGFITPAEQVLAALGGVCRAVRLSGDEVCNPGILSSAAFDLLVVPTGTAFPAAAEDALLGFLAGGGCLLTSGGYAFDTPVVKIGGKWISPKAFNGNIPAGTIDVALPKSTEWHSGGNAGAKTEMADVRGPAGEPGVRVSTPMLSGWNTAATALDLKGRSVISFLAKGDAQTKSAWFEVDERDGSRWHCKLELTEDWKEFRFTPAQFDYWPDNPSVGRGLPGDHVNFDAVQRLSLGMATDVVSAGESHSVSLCALKIGDDPHRAERCLQLPQFNTRTALIRDAIHPRPEQIGMFDPSFELRGVARYATCPEMKGVIADGLAEPLSLAGTRQLTGLSAIAQLGVNGHGFGPNRCTWRPLLAGFDGGDRPRGHLGAFVHHYAGNFSGSSWACFGVDNADLFDVADARQVRWVRAMVAALMRRRFLHDTTAQYACYRPGETMRLQTCAANHSAAVAGGTVVFTLRNEGGDRVAELKQSFTVPVDGEVPVEVEWKVPEDAPDYLTLEAEWFTAGQNGQKPQLHDRESGAVVIWNDRVLAGGPKLRKEGLHLTIDGQSRFFMGNQTFWGQHGSVTASSPRRFYDDFRQMRNFGLRWTRCFLPFRTEKEIRDSDAVVQLAQKFGIVLYYTPNLHNTRDPKELARQHERIAAIAKRYAKVPGLAIDICNEPSMGEVTSRGATDAQREWARGNVAAAKAMRPELPLSVGWSQGWAGGKSTKDPQVASLDLDFTDRHYYGRPTALVPEVKDVDLRVLGKPLIVGECGAKNHPTFKSSDPWGMGDDDEGYDYRFRYLVSHVFGNGATALLSWHWRDPMEGIFPCGLVHATNVPRPTALLFARMAHAFGQLELVDNPPDVVVLLDEDSRQHADVRRERTIKAAHRVDEALMWWGANWSKLTSSMAGKVPASVKLVIRPETLGDGDLREEVGRLLKSSGASFTRRDGDPKTLETFRVPGRDAVGWVFWNGGDRPVEVERGGHRLRIGAFRVGYLQLTSGGALQVREAF